MLWLAVASLVLAGVVGFVLTLLTLPGIWLPIGVALLFQWFRPDMFSWWVIGAAVVIGLLAEAMEVGASAVGASKSGGTKRSAVGAIGGTVVGAILGSFIPLFPIGTILGAIAGAGVGAGLLDRSRTDRTWGQSATVGAGAATARGIAIVVKGAMGAAIALTLIIGALVHGL